MNELESLCENFDKWLPPVTRSISDKKFNSDNFQNGLVNPLHEFRFQIGDGTGRDSPVVDVPDLVDELDRRITMGYNVSKGLRNGV